MTRHNCTCPEPCATRALHALKCGEQRAVATMRVLCGAIEQVVSRHARRTGDRP